MLEIWKQGLDLCQGAFEVLICQYYSNIILYNLPKIFICNGILVIPTTEYVHSYSNHKLTPTNDCFYGFLEGNQSYNKHQMLQEGSWGDNMVWGRTVVWWGC